MFTTCLANGLKVLVVANPAVDIASFRFFLRSGASSEPIPGLAHLLCALLTKGTARYSSLALAERIEAMGAMLGADSNPDYMLVSGKSLGEDFPAVLELACELLREASLGEDQLALERRVTLQAIRSQQERPFTVAYNQFRSALYGDHPYAHTDLGTDESVARITRSDLVAFYRTHFRPDNLVFIAVGPLDPAAVVAQLERHLGDWQAPERPLAPQGAAVATVRPGIVRQVQSTQQSTILVGYGAAPVHSEDFAALKLIATYLGSGLSSRLFTELREKRGLAYEVSAFYPTRVAPSHFITYIGTAPENTRTCEEGLKRETERLCDHCLDDSELRLAKNKLLGQYALSKQTNSQIAQLFGWYEAIGVGADFDQEYTRRIDALDAATLRTVAQRTFHSPIVSLVGPAEALATV